MPRLFKKKELIRSKGKVHESPEINGEFGYAKNPIKHLTARTVAKMLEKSVKWAKIEADLYSKKPYPKVTIFKVTKAMVKEFTGRYIIKLGFLDGTIGLIQAIFQSLHTAMILTYLWEIQNRTEEKVKNFRNE